MSITGIWKWYMVSLIFTNMSLEYLTPNLNTPCIYVLSMYNLNGFVVVFLTFFALPGWIRCLGRFQTIPDTNLKSSKTKRYFRMILQCIANAQIPMTRTSKALLNWWLPSFATVNGAFATHCRITLTLQRPKNV